MQCNAMLCYVMLCMYVCMYVFTALGKHRLHPRPELSGAAQASRDRGTSRSSSSWQAGKGGGFTGEMGVSIGMVNIWSLYGDYMVITGLFGMILVSYAGENENGYYWRHGGFHSHGGVHGHGCYVVMVILTSQYYYGFIMFHMDKTG